MVVLYFKLSNWSNNSVVLHIYRTCNTVSYKQCVADPEPGATEIDQKINK
jgi:hypothetical protein